MKLIVGSRKSRLAMMQTEVIINQLLVYHPGLIIERKTFPEESEEVLAQSMEMATGKAPFIKELEEALLEEKIDFAVHSMKDMPMDVSEELPIVAMTKREDPRDCLLLRKDLGMGEELNERTIGTSSLRRKSQLEALYKGIQVKELHGGIVDRIRRMEQGEYDGVILSAAGVKRAGFTGRIAKYFEVEEVVPAAGQGILAVQTRRGREDTFLEAINEEASVITSCAERAYIKELGGSCHAPMGAYCCIKNNKLYLTGMYYQEATGRCYKESVIGYKNEAEKLGIFFANYMKRRYLR